VEKIKIKISNYREKIVRALVENALVALFELYHNFPGTAAEVRADCEETADNISIRGGCSDTNGTTPRTISGWLYQHRRCMIDCYKKRSRT
jgi:hypothetical protein